MNGTDSRDTYSLFYVAVSEKPLRILSSKWNDEGGIYGRRIWPQLPGCTGLEAKGKIKSISVIYSAGGKGLIKGGGHSNREEDTLPRNGHKRNKGKNQTFFSDYTEYLVS